jgi:hypothetical protein
VGTAGGVCEAGGALCGDEGSIDNLCELIPCRSLHQPSEHKKMAEALLLSSEHYEKFS